MHPEGSLPRPWQLATDPYPEPDQSSPPPFYFLKTHFNIIFPSNPKPSKWFLAFSTPHQNPVCTSPLIHTCHMPNLSHSSDLITSIVFGEENRSLSSSLWNFLHLSITSSHLGPYIFLSTLFSNTLNLHSSLSTRNQVSHPYKTTRVMYGNEFYMRNFSNGFFPLL